MNTQSIGPNLNLAPFADPGDGQFEVILISERQRDEFATYVHNKLHGIEQPPIFNILKAKNLAGQLRTARCHPRSIAMRMDSLYLCAIRSADTWSSDRTKARRSHL